jgi:hypothetical protein
VYKVDRLTRALSDFAKLVDIFDRCSVSFVSITQQFNTTTSMGRLTLNVLLSFAQFEREVIGERVRDKIAASKKKGMWMGGMPSLGFDVKDRKLVVNDAEAHTVVDIYRRYLALKSVRALADELATAGIRSKRRVRSDGTEYGGQKLSRGALYLMLQNRIYRGEITHQGKSYPGDHPAIIEKPLWDEVQAVLATNRIKRETGAHTRHPSLLTGLLFDDKGDRLTPTYSIKNGTRYRYYVSTGLVTGAKMNRSNGVRLPAVAMLQAGRNGPLVFLLTAVAAEDGLPHEAAFFWLTGILSAFLDNAPTYLVFFELAGGDPIQLMGPLAGTLAAISMGAVYMGALSYIGNAPNFMVYAIAQESGIKMPSFFGYLFYASLILLPFFLLLALLPIAPVLKLS